jgi:hypothetical protein
MKMSWLERLGLIFVADLASAGVDFAMEEQRVLALSGL